MSQEEEEAQPRFVCALVALVSRVMCAYCTTELVDSVERHTQLFLNSYVKMDSFLSKDGDKGWVSHYNFLCTLNIPDMNIPDMMSQYGVLRNLWEGSFRGEGFLRIVKPLIENGVRRNWAKNLMTRCMKVLAFYRLRSQLGSSDDVMQCVVRYSTASVSVIFPETTLSWVVLTAFRRSLYDRRYVSLSIFQLRHSVQLGSLFPEETRLL